MRNWIKRIPTSLRQVLLFSFGGILGMSCMAGYFIYQNSDNSDDTNDSIRQSGYKYINPLLECEMQNKIERQKYIPFEDVTINRIKTEVINKHPNVQVGVYVRNLNNGPWFGINENEHYSPASILKLPILITYLKWIEKDSSIWDKKLLLGEETSEIHYFAPSKNLIPGKEYTVRDLLNELIVYSDNKSMSALTRSIPRDLYLQVNKDLGITVPGIKTPEDFLSVKDMATFFRILYNASYLERDTSEYALELLTHVNFDTGLRAGVPTSIPIAHKFGERGYTDEKTDTYIRQLHDCGIIYYKKYPYLACIVTKGNDFDENASIIANTSKIIFEEISKAFPEK